jgi:hypothetical protein
VKKSVARRTLYADGELGGMALYVMTCAPPRVMQYALVSDSWYVNLGREDYMGVMYVEFKVLGMVL